MLLSTAPSSPRSLLQPSPTLPSSRPRPGPQRRPQLYHLRIPTGSQRGPRLVGNKRSASSSPSSPLSAKVLRVDLPDQLILSAPPSLGRPACGTSMPPTLRLSLPGSPAGTRDAPAPPPPAAPPLRVEPANNKQPRASQSPRLALHLLSDISSPPLSRPDLLVQPASPALSSPESFESASSPSSASCESPVASTSLLPFPPVATSLAARRKNKKLLSLVVPTSNVPASLASPGTPAALLHPGGLSNAETRSLPPSPISLAAYIGVEGSEQEDRTIGRLMLRQQADEMREQMKGGRGMKRRTSIPRLNLAGAGHKPAALNLGSTNGGSAVKLIRRDAVENRGYSHEGDAMDLDEVPEEFPYALGPREIIPGVWLGSEANARDPQVIRDGKFNWVLNVAKEVECPWVGEVISEEEDEDGNSSSTESTRTRESSTSSTTSISEAWTRADPPPIAKPKHRRTKTQAAIQVPPPPAARALFVRPTASTPNLQSAFNSTVASPPPLPPIPSFSRMERRNSEGENDLSPTTGRSLHSSPSQLRRSPSHITTATAPSFPPPLAPTHSTPLLFPESRRTGRPALEYLWLKWGHDESDLVEAGKLQDGFDFLDRARASAGGKGNVLVHCQCGVSRSATLVIAYCMREAARALEEGRETSELAGVTGMHDAYSFVKEKSEWVGPNLCLVFQLVAYERTLRGGPQDPDDEEPPFPDYSNQAASDSPRTPLSSEGSSDSQLSTPEAGGSSAPPSFDTKSTSPPLSIVTARQDLTLRVHGEDEEEVLGPLAHALSLHPHDVETLSTEKALDPAQQQGVFILPTPPRRFLDISPLPHNVTMAPSTPYDLPIDSPAPSRLTFADNPLQRWGFPTPPKATLLTSTPTAAAFSLPKVPSAAQLSLSRGLPPSSPVTETDPRKVFGGQQTPSQRRASHRRVFSWSSAKDVPPPPPS